jgi:dTDP-4-amino-4,6-dideoxygalactose transaminase
MLSLKAINIGKGDEVIVPSNTYIATWLAVSYVGATPIPLEPRWETCNINPDLIEAKISPNTKAIMPVNLYGQAAEMDAIMNIALKHNLYVIEDNAQAIGATIQFSDGTVRMTGTIGDIGCTSFFPSKNLGCFGDGGAIVTRDASLADKMRMIANHGQSKRYYHDIVGCNSRLDSIQAAVLNVKLRHLNQYNEARRQAAAFYSKAFSSNSKITVPHIADGNTHVFHQYTLILKDHNRD